MTREELTAEADRLMAERIRLKSEIKACQRRYAATGKRADWEWFNKTEEHIARLFAKENELRAKARSCPNNHLVSVGRKYWSMCRIIEKEFGEATLRSLVIQAEELARAEVEAGILKEVDDAP